MAIYLTQRGGDETRVDEIEGKLKSTIPDLKRVPSVEAIDPKAVNGAERSIVILAAASRMGPNVDELIDAVRRSPRNLFFIVVGGDISARDYKRLIQSGNADWVAEVGLPHEIRDIVERVSAPARDDVAGDSPTVVSFTPSAGGVGNSTLAIETAIHLVRAKSSKGARVALVDLDFQSSHVCDYLDIAPKFQFEEIVAAPDRLDDHLLSAFISHHPSGLGCVGGEPQPVSRPRSQRRGSVRLVRSHGAALFHDHHRSAALRPCLDACHCSRRRRASWSPGSTPFRACDRSRRRFGRLREEPTITADVRAVVNRCDFGFLGKMARADHVARILGEEKALLRQERRRLRSSA